LTASFYTEHFDDIDARAREVYAGMKWYAVGEVPEGLYLYGEMQYLWMHVTVEHDEVSEKLSDTGYGAGIGYGLYKINDGLPYFISFSFGVLGGGEDREWVSSFTSS